MIQRPRMKSPSTILLIVVSALVIAAFVAIPGMRGQRAETVSAPATDFHTLNQINAFDQNGARVDAGLQQAAYQAPADHASNMHQADVLPVFPQFAAVDSGKEIQLCQGLDPCCNSCGDYCGGACGGTEMVSAPMMTGNFVDGGVICDGSCGGTCGSPDCAAGLGTAYGRDPYGNGGAAGKPMIGVDNFNNNRGREPGWNDQHMVPWEAFAYGEYVGPHRTPHVPEYRLRVNDGLEFIYMLTRERSRDPYQLYVGDVISITSREDETLTQPQLTILSDGMISLPLIGQVRASGKSVADLQRELNDKYSEYIIRPGIVLQVIESDTPLKDLVDTVDARAGQGGQRQAVTVTPDGTISLPMVGSIPAVGLTLEEIRREVNARYRLRIRGIEVTPILTQRAVGNFYVVGEVENPGQFALNGPTTVLQALAQSGQINDGANLRQVIVFRRDHNWRLMATRIDLAGTFYGRRPHPSDDVWLRPSDIVMVPKKPILRFSEAVNLYLTSSLYAIFPQQGVAFNFDGFTNL